LKAVVSLAEVMSVQNQVRHVRFDDSVLNYLQDLIEATRTSNDLHVGASTRGALGIYRACQSLALIENRDYVVPDDVKRLAIPALAHRVVARGFAAGADRAAAEAIIRSLLDRLTVPT
jgi:MoxR-like ATPase